MRFARCSRKARTAGRAKCFCAKPEYSFSWYARSRSRTESVEGKSHSNVRSIGCYYPECADEMRSTRILAGSVLLIGLRCFGQTSPAPQPVFSISVAPPAGPIHLGLPINITVTVTNVSSEEIDWRSDRSSDTVYRAFTVMLTKNGSEVETTVFDRKITGRHRTSDPREVQPGSSISLPHPPGKMFVDDDQPGPAL